MSLLGTAAALAGAAVIALALTLHLQLTPGKAVLTADLIFSQTLVDTLLGACLQIKYRCTACGALTERRQHCNMPAVRASGLSWMNNNMVNLLSSLLVTAAAFALL